MTRKKSTLKILLAENRKAEENAMVEIINFAFPGSVFKTSRSNKEFERHLFSFEPDAVISCLKFEKYSAKEALQFLNNIHRDLPFVIINSERISKENILELTKLGADSFMLWENLNVLPMAISQSIEKAQWHKEKKLAEKKLVAEESRLNTIYSNEPEAIISLGLQGEILDVNPTAVNLLRSRKNDRIVGKKIWDYIDKGDVKDFRKFHSSIFRGNKKVLRYRVHDAKGKTFWLEANAVPLRDEDGAVISMLTINRDITREKEAKKEISNYTSIVRSILDPIISLDENFLIKSWNHGADKIFGWIEKDVIGNHFDELCRTEYVSATRDEFLRDVKEKGHWDGEINIWTKSKTRLHILASFSRIETEEGNYSGMVGLLRNITELKKGQEEIVKSENKFRTLTSFAPVGIFLTDHNGDCIFVNEKWCELSGFGIDEAMGKGWAKALHPDDRNRVFHEWYEAAKAGKDFHTECRFLTPEGKTNWLSANARILVDNEQKNYGYVGAITDISPHVYASEKIKENKQRLEFAQMLGRIGDWDFDPMTRTGHWSKEMFAVFERDMHRGVPSFEEFMSYVHPEDRSRIQNSILGTLDHKKASVEDYRIVLPGNKTKYIQSYISPHHEIITGKNILIGTAQDITEQKKSMENTRLSEVRFKSLFNNSPDAIYVEDENGNILDANEKACKVQGYLRDELIGKNILDITPPEFRKDIETNFRKLFEQEKSVHESYTWDKDWKKIPVEINSGRIEYNGKTALLLLVRDLSERKKAEQKFRNLLESAPDAKVIVNDKGSIELVNAQTEKMFGYPRSELIGKPVEMLIPELFPNTHELHLSGFTAQPHTQSMGSVLELSGRKKDGSEFPAEISLGPIETEEGRLITASIRDVTLRKQNELKRYEAEKKLSSLVASAPFGICTLNINRELTYVNERLCEIFGMTRQEMMEGKGWSVLHPDDREKIFRKREEAAKTSSGIQSVFRITVNGKEKKLHGQSSQVTDENGNTVEYVATIVDITSLQDMEN